MAKLETTILINNRPVAVEWTRAASHELAKRSRPIIVELELYFSCLVKKFVHFHETAPDREVIMVSDKILLFFRTVTSTACSFDVAERLGRQPETELDNPNVRKMAPRLVKIDYVKEKWQGDFWI